MSDAMRKRAELADFPKTRRSRLHPEQFGLPDGGRRRTPGLRRDEVAQLAGVGVSWYTWLEQGRAITVSDQVLESLARILRLDAGERRHLFLLARGMVPVSDENHAVNPLPPGQQAVLDALGISPAYLLDQRFTVVAWNESACRVFEDFSLLSERDRNAIWSIFMHPAKRKLFVDWELAICRTWRRLNPRSFCRGIIVAHLFCLVRFIDRSALLQDCTPRAFLRRCAGEEARGVSCEMRRTTQSRTILALSRL